MFKFGPTKVEFKPRPIPTNRWVAIQYGTSIYFCQVCKFGGEDFIEIFRGEWVLLKSRQIIAEETR